VTDLNLPDARDGAAVELVTQSRIPCIAFTGNFSTELRAMVLKLGVADYVLKNSQSDILYVVKMIQRLRSNADMRVLVVDDFKATREYLGRVLESQCFDVVTVDSGETALEELERNCACRIMLIDLVMEGMDGFELLEEVRKRFDVTQMSIIGLSGKASSEQVARFMKYGGNDFLIKPFEQEQVCCRVNTNAQLLEQFDRLAELNEKKNRLMSMAAHDIRGPLGVVLSAASMLKREVSSEQGKMVTSLLADAADEMEELLNSLLDISVVQATELCLKLERVDLVELVNRVIAGMQIQLDAKDQTLELDLPRNPVWIVADPGRLKEVVQNLLSNAVKYSSRGGRIGLSVSVNPRHARIQVLDEAGGVPESEQSRLFEPLADISTQPTEGERSTGLGLAICQHIVSLHKGAISYRDNLHIGSLFEVVLPVADAEIRGGQ